VKTAELYDALLLWANRAFTVVNPAFVFVATLLMILAGLELSHFGWRAKRRGHTAAGLLVTGCAAAWSTLGFIVARSGGGGLTPRESAFLPFFFGLSGLLAMGSLGMQFLQHRALRRTVSHEEASRL